MNAELKRKWIAALRSGEFKQGRYALRPNGGDSFCCLGVLCEVAGLPRVHGAAAYDFGGNNVSGLNIRGALRADVNAGVDLEDTERTSIVANMNDDGAPFSTIADWIEANIPEDAA